MFEFNDTVGLSLTHVYMKVHDNTFVIKIYHSNYNILVINFNMDMLDSAYYIESNCLELNKTEYSVLRYMLVNYTRDAPYYIDPLLYNHNRRFWKHICLNLHEYLVIVQEELNSENSYIFYVNMRTKTVNEVKVYDSINPGTIDPGIQSQCRGAAFHSNLRPPGVGLNYRLDGNSGNMIQCSSIFNNINHVFVYAISESYIDICTVDTGLTIPQFRKYNSNIYYFNRSSHSLHRIFERPNIMSLVHKIIIQNRIIDLGNGEFLYPPESRVITTMSRWDEIHSPVIAIMEPYLPAELCEIVLRYAFCIA